MKKKYTVFAVTFCINFLLHKVYGKRFGLVSLETKKNLFFKTAGRCLFGIIFLQGNYFCSAQDNDKAGQLLWTIKNPFEHKVFIENNGQFMKIEEETKSKIYYAHFSKGVEMYFTSEGVLFRRKQARIKRHEGDGINSAERAEIEKEGEKKIHYDIKIVRMLWEKAENIYDVTGEEAVNYYFTYPSDTKHTGNKGIKASAFKKIVCRNVYPLIDVEYYFTSSEDQGIKYAFRLHPGADASRIKMKYSVNGLRMSATGNLEIPTSFGTITDLAPQTFYASGNLKIASGFYIKDNTVSFSLGEYDHSKEIIIDPFLSAPVFDGYNGAYDIDYDKMGNVYIYGGGNGFQELKYNNSGILQWVFSASTLDPYYYGDFALDRNTGSSYLSTGVDFYYAAIIKINAAGIFQTDILPNHQLHELWRLAYNNCTKQLIVGGGGWGNTFQSALVDTNLSFLTPVNVLAATNDYHDIAMLAVDNLNNCYMATARGNPGFDNMILKTSSNTLSPLSFMIPDQMLFEEQYSFNYICGKGNGFSGIAVTDKYLYMYNSSALQRRNKVTGALINSSTLGTATYGWGGQIIIDYGGLAVDNCENIYVGSKSSILKCDSNFNVLATLSAADSIYDIKVSEGNFLYACGSAFVSAYKLTGAVCNDLSLSVLSVPCSVNGSATAIVNGGTGSYTVSWMPDNQNGSNVSGLSPGLHTVTATDGSCNPKVATATVNITAVPVAAIIGSDSVCAGENATLTASGNGNIFWSNGATASSIVISPVVSETYSLIVINADGCSDTATKFVSVNSAPFVTVGGDDTICSGQQANLYAAGNGNFSWSTGQHTSSIVTYPSANTTFSVTVTNSSGCTARAFATVIVNPKPTAAIYGADTVCAGSAIMLSASGNGAFKWSTGENSPSIIISPQFTTLFSLIVTNNTGCSDSSVKRVIVKPVPNASITGIDTICAGDRILLFATGGEKYFWNSGHTDSVIAVAPLSTHLYTVIVSNGPCIDSATKKIVVLQVPHANISVTGLSEFTNQLVAVGGKNYNWFEGEGLSCSDCSSAVVSQFQSMQYCVAVSNEMGCSDTACTSITVSSVFIPTAFTPDENNLNDLFKPVVNDVSEYSFAIFNRWGEKIFVTDDTNAGWNGYYNGSPCAEDVYVYKLSYRNNEEKKHYDQIGKVTLIR